MLTTIFLIILAIHFTLWSVNHIFQAIFKLFAFPSVFGSNPVVVWLMFLVFLAFRPSFVIILLILGMILRRRFLFFMGLFKLELSLLTFIIVCMLNATDTWFPSLEI